MDEIHLVDPDETWADQFRCEELQLRATLEGQVILAIEHFGSTAIRGLIAKPIIDILIAVPSVPHARDPFVERLAQLEYVFWADNPAKDRLFLVKGMPPYGERRTHHVHVVERPSQMWSRLAFRDYLRAHPTERDNYAELKRALARKHASDREAYTEAKAAFVARIMRLAGK